MQIMRNKRSIKIYWFIMKSWNTAYNVYITEIVWNGYQYADMYTTSNDDRE